MVSLVIGTAGHIDHGKSTLVRALTGIDPDRLKEEKARGITIDLGFAHADVEGVHVAFVDVPGHERFVKNMLAGVGGIDAVLLVIAADESVMPQTREHFDICRLLRIPAGVIALTKADLADADTIALTTIEARELVAGTFLAEAPIVPVSATTGAGLDNLRHALAALPHALEGRSRPAAARATRLPIDRVFTMKGFGTVVTGTLVAGAIAQEEELVVAPSGRPVKVRGLQVHGAAAQSVRAGHRVAANLGGVDVSDIARGDVLMASGALLPTRRVDALVELLPSARPLRHGARVRFHHGTTELLGRVSMAAARHRSGDAIEPAQIGSELEPGREGYVRLRLEAPTVLARGDRFILRAYSPAVTIAGGEVLDPQPPRSGVRTEAGRRRFGALDPVRTSAQVAHALVEESGAGGLSVTALGARLGIARGEVDDIGRQLSTQGIARDVGGLLVAETVLSALSKEVVADLEAHHRAHPLSEGLPREELRTRRFARAHETVFEAVLARLAGERLLNGRDRLALASHRVELSAEELDARERIEAAFRQAGLKPLAVSELTATLRVQPAVADRVIKLLTRQRVLIRLDDLFFHADALAQLRADVIALKQAAEPARVDVGSFKEKYGITRKFAIPLLEYLDRERVTRRVGDARIVL
ncbi:MAG TPA: selenocysteine-specific translation elongation factor [Vicinamibacterales bacterium]|nr:selenocysteine-specific translation elongation factor [Vicinamibacterales bacterium]